MEKKRLGRAILFIILLLLAVQVTQPGIVHFKSMASWIKNGLWESFFGTLLFNFVLGVLFIALAILVILNKKWIRIPLIIILSLFTVYSVYSLITHLIHKEQMISSLSVIYGTQIARRQVTIGTIQSIGYTLLSILGLILSWFNLNKPKI